MASITCGKCKGTHSYVDEVRLCYGLEPKTVGGQQAKKMGISHIPSWREAHDYKLKRNRAQSEIGTEIHRKLEEFTGQSDPGMVQLRVPAGRYALETSGDWKFYKVSHGKAGSSWEGYVFVEIQAGSDHHRISSPSLRNRILNEISKDARQAAIDYGKQLGKCAICNRELTDPESISCGIGPICAQRVGW